MKPQEILVRAPGSFVFIGGGDDVDSPMLEDRPVRLWSNAQCVCVGTRSEVDGYTRLVVGSDVAQSMLTLAFAGEVTTDNHRLVVTDAVLNVLIEADVPSRRTFLSIGTDDPREPTLIVIDVQNR